jgi:hypothetical protein
MLTLEPDLNDSRAVFLRHAEMPGAAVRLLMWEKIYYLNWAQNGWRGVTGNPSAFIFTEKSRGIQRELRSVDGVHASLALQPHGELLEVTIAVTNITREIDDPFWGTFDIHDLWLDLCVHYRECEVFRDPEFSRTFVSVDGRPTPLAETNLTGHRKAISGYWLKDQSFRLRATPELQSTYGTGISATQPDAPWLAVESRDRQFTLLTTYPRVHNLWANRREPMHGCIHANPLVGDIPVGSTARMTGLVLLARCTLLEGIERSRTFLREHDNFRGN